MPLSSTDTRPEAMPHDVDQMAKAAFANGKYEYGIRLGDGNTDKQHPSTVVYPIMFSRGNIQAQVGEIRFDSTTGTLIFATSAQTCSESAAGIIGKFNADLQARNIGERAMHTIGDAA